MFERGRLMPRMRFWASAVRGRIAVEEKRDEERCRVVRVARLFEAKPSPDLELLDVQLVGSFGEGFTFSGYERVAAETTDRFTTFAQSWVLLPGPVKDLEKTEQLAVRLARELAEVKGEPGEPPWIGRGGSRRRGTGAGAPVSRAADESNQAPQGSSAGLNGPNGD